MFSDGFADQFGGKNRKKYKYKRFRELLAKTALVNNLQNQKETLHKELNQWKSGIEQIDDILVIGIKI